MSGEKDQTKPLGAVDNDATIAAMRGDAAPVRPTLQKLLEQAAAVPWPPPPAFSDPDALRSKAIQLFLLKLEPELNDALIQELSEIPGLSKTLPGMVQTGNGAHRLETEHVLKWCIQRTREVGAVQTVAEASAFFAANACDVEVYVAVSGIEVARTYEVTEAISVVPMSKVPRSGATDSLLGRDEFVLPGVKMWNAEWEPPKTLLRKRFRHSPVIRAPDDETFILNNDDIFEVVLGLSAATSSYVALRASWLHFPPSVPNQVDLPSPIHHVGEIEVSHHGRDQVAVTDDHIRIAKAFLALSPEVRTPLHLPIGRLGLSRVRRQAVDLAVELGIAFESLLIAGETKTQLTEKGMARLATLIGGTRLERQAIRSWYEAFYDLRSAAVHTGKVDLAKEYKMTGLTATGTTRKKAPEILTKATELCAAAIVKIIELGAAPDWATSLPSLDEQSLINQIRPKAPTT